MYGYSAIAQNPNDMSGMDMSAVSNQNNDSNKHMHDMPGMGGDGSASVMHSMEGHHMDMGPHLKMTSLRATKPGDPEKADLVVQAARATAEKYKDYKLALADGYKIFLPNLPQKQYHFTNYWYALRARNHFDPSHATSLLYEKNGDDYKLIGVVYTAPRDASEDNLNARIPLSIAQWHAHVNLCMPPREKRPEVMPPNRAETRRHLVGGAAA